MRRWASFGRRVASQSGTLSFNIRLPDWGIDVTQRGSIERQAVVWVSSHPAEAERLVALIRGTFAFRKCNENRGDDVLCPDCFRELYREVATIDPELPGHIGGNADQWLRALIRTVLTDEPRTGA